ncbi:MAG: type II toxin-antitoxin system HicA family toxin [Terriglobia bacterium]
MARVVRRLGFEFRRQAGSHAIYVRPTDHARVVIPMHSGVAIKRKTLRAISQTQRRGVLQPALRLRMPNSQSQCRPQRRSRQARQSFSDSLTFTWQRQAP